MRLRRSLPVALLVLVACNDDSAPSDHDHGAHSHGEGGHAHQDDAGHTHDDAGYEQALQGSDAGPPEASVLGAFEWQLPQLNWPRPPVPADNPISNEKVELGRHLFYDPTLSKNGTQSCAMCHRQALAFSDGRAVGLGSTNELHSRGSMSLANVGYAQTLTWSNPLFTDLEQQAHTPIFGDSPVELGNDSIADVEQRFRALPLYRELFRAAFPGEAEPITIVNLQRALASFQRTIISGSSPYDKYMQGDESALSESAKRGMVFVTTNEDHRFECNHCHGGLFFTDQVTWEGRSQRGDAPPFHQTGLYDLDGQGRYPAPNTGVFSVTDRPEDMGKFKAPTLRNIALTAPYMHDGSMATLSDVLDHYAKGGRARVTGKTDPLLQPFEMTEQEKADIIAFLESLTDRELLTNPKYASPWK